MEKKEGRIGFNGVLNAQAAQKVKRRQSIRALFVIPGEVEEWSEWDERHGATCRESAERESGDERVQSLIVSEIGYIERCLHFGRHDTGLFAPLIHPIVHGLIPKLTILRL